MCCMCCSVQIQQPFSDSEKLRLLEQLEKAETCVRILGKQVCFSFFNKNVEIPSSES